MLKEGLELRRAVFEKMGAEWKKNGRHLSAEAYDDTAEDGWAWFLGPMQISDTSFQNIKHESELVPHILPPIETSWEVCAKYPVKWMREREWHYTIGFVGSHDLRPVFYWQGGKDQKWAMRSEIIQNDNLALAACEAFMEVEV